MLRRKNKQKLICRLNIHRPQRTGRDLTGRRVYACKHCHVVMI